MISAHCMAATVCTLHIYIKCMNSKPVQYCIHGEGCGGGELFHIQKFMGTPGRDSKHTTCIDHDYELTLCIIIVVVVRVEL